MAVGEITAEIMASPLSAQWLSPGHAFVCIAIHLNTGIKEDCVGFYSSSVPGSLIVGAPSLSNEFKRNPLRFSQVSWSLKKRISGAQRQAFYGRLNDVVVGNYHLLNNNCGDFVHGCVAALGWPNVAASLLPETYVRELFTANILRFEHSLGRFERAGGLWREYHSATSKVFTFSESRHDAQWLELRDSSRSMNVMLPVQGGMSRWSNGGSYANLYNVVPVVE